MHFKMATNDHDQNRSDLSDYETPSYSCLPQNLGSTSHILWEMSLLRYRMAGITESAMVAYTHKYAVV